MDGYSTSFIDNAFSTTAKFGEIGSLRGDMAAICLEFPHPPKEVIIEGAIFENYSFSNRAQDIDFSSIIFRNCLIESLDLIDSGQDEFLPKFQRCLFIEIRGRSSKEDLPSKKFDSICTFDRFSDSSKTNSSILSSSLTRGEKIILTILRKLFVQSLSGRAESALFRGLDLNDRQLIPEFIKLLQQHDLITLYNRGDGNVWIPNRKEINRARKILATPNGCDDPVMREAKSLVK